MTAGDVTWVIAGLGFLGWAAETAASGRSLRSEELDEADSVSGEDSDHPAGP